MLLEHKLFIVYFKTHTQYLLSMGLALDPDNDQLPVVVITQLLEHCTAITESRSGQSEVLRSFVRYCPSSIT